MLTSNLLPTRTYKGKIEPIYVALDQEHKEISSIIIAIFQSHVGKSYGALLEEIEGFEEINYRLIRGLAQILERRCKIERHSVIDPINARKAVFKECRGFVTSSEERKEVLDTIARKFSIQSTNLEKALWSDLEENLVIKEFDNITPEHLLIQYNISLTQTLLFKATRMEIQVEDHYQQVFRNIKRLGLIYSIDQDKICIEGPVSLFKLTERYGTSFAKLLPIIMRCSTWSLKASILKKTIHGKRIYDFTLDNTKQIFSPENYSDSNLNFDKKFDSAIEKEFSQLNFNDWSVRREPSVLQAGQYAFIPDFSLEKNGCRIYVEIVGFWTPEYLKHKIQKINQLKEKEKENMILLVDKNLSCSGSEFNIANLIFYDKKIPYLDIIKILRKYEEKELAEEVEKLKNIKISLEGYGGVLHLDELARHYGVSIDALKQVIKPNINGYLLIGNQLVDNHLLKAIKSDLNGVKKHSEAVKIIQSYNIKSQQIFEFLGYKVKWNGLDPENAEIVLTV
jgi:predicted nuclease of restriction endonuclease-like RecB superfamily